MPSPALAHAPPGDTDVGPRRPGRPKGSRSPLARWLLAEIGQRKREGYTCHDAFYILMNEHEADVSKQVSTETRVSERQHVETEAARQHDRNVMPSPFP